MMPIHSMLVHFPIAFCLLEFFFLFLWQFKKDPTYLRVARTVFRLTFFMILIAMAAGLYDAGGFDEIHGAVREHVIAALGFFGVYLIRSSLWGFGKKADSAAKWILFAGSLAGILLMVITAYHGAELVYYHG